MPAIATTSAIGTDVTDTRTLRVGTLAGPVRWSCKQLRADVRMADTGQVKRIPVSTLRLTPHAASAWREADRRAARDTPVCDGGTELPAGTRIGPVTLRANWGGLQEL